MTLSRTLAPEWFPQSAVQLTWPHAATDWAYMLQDVTDCYVRLAFEIATREPLLIVAPEVESVRRLLEEKLPRAPRKTSVISRARRTTLGRATTRSLRL